MARITVEDCLKNVENRFDLVLRASKRARELSMGVEATLPWENDKPTVMALREIAEGTIRTRDAAPAEHFDLPLGDAAVEVEVDETIVVEATDAAEAPADETVEVAPEVEAASEAETAPEVDATSEADTPADKEMPAEKPDDSETE